MRTYKAYRDLLASERWRKLAAAGAHPQRLLVGQHGHQGSESAGVALCRGPGGAGYRRTRCPRRRLKAFAAQGHVGAPMPVDGGYAEQVLDEFRREGVDIDALAELQLEGGDSFVKSWNSLIGGLNEKVTKLTVTSPS
jgi:transaldolase